MAAPNVHPPDGNAAADRRRRQRSPFRRHFAFGLLTAFNLATVAAGLAVNHRALSIQQETVERNQHWSLHYDQLAALTDLAGEANEPGNAVFETRDVRAARAAQAQADAAFLAALREMGGSLHSSPTARHAELAPWLDAIGARFDAVATRTAAIFDAMERDDHDGAGVAMAQMDGGHRELARALSRFGSRLSALQQQDLADQQQTLATLRVVELALCGMILLLVAAIGFFGHWLAMRREREERERRELASSLEVVESRTRAIVETSSDAILTVARTGRIESANAAANALFRAGDGGLTGRPLAELLPRLDGLERHGETVGSALDGAPLELEFARTECAADALVFTTIVARDVSERRRAVELLEKARRDAEEAARSKGFFLANMSHEIRTPMNGIIGMTGLLLESPLDAEQREYARTARSCSEALLDLLNGILDLSKIEAGRLELEAIEFDPQALLDDVFDIVAARADEGELERMGDLDPELPARLIGDPGRVRQVLLNLVGNAVKFSRPGGDLEVAIRVGERREGRCTLRFSVRDSGIGIPPERIAKLFTPFTQVDASTTRHFGGTGLGLALARELVTRMGGTIGVESREGVGSTFWFELPFAVAAERAPLAEADRKLLAGLPVLVVDDNDAHRRILASRLTAWGCRPVALASGAEALARATSGDGSAFRVALIDYRMPEMDGLELAHRLGATLRERTPRLILFSSVGGLGDIARTGAPGVFHRWLAKPCREAQLLATLLEAAERRSVRRDADEPKRAVAEPTTACSAARILLAEDNPVNQKVACTILRKAGHSVTVAGNGREAIEKLMAAPFDVVLMDCQMPELDGFAATRAIRGLPDERAKVPILALTANALADDRDAAFACGMNDFLPKPVRPQLLLAAVARLARQPAQAAS
ncbi:MAG: response regulator [Planctomycetes bacterium]|nr:response regulator [Planctomycetota bacterium]